MAQYLIRPVSGPNRLPTMSTPAPATCSTECQRGRRAWTPRAPAAATCPVSLSCPCVFNRAPELSHHSLASPLSLPRSLVLRASSGTRPPRTPPRARAGPLSFFHLRAPGSPASTATGSAVVSLASRAPPRPSFAAVAHGHRCRGRLCAWPG